MATTQPFDMVLFGATGDLVMRKILPALYDAHRAGSLHAEGRIVALGRHDGVRDDYLAQVRDKALPHVKSPGTDWDAFVARIDYLKLDAERDDDFRALAQRVQRQPGRVTVCYLATAPRLFSGICARLAAVGLNHADVRVVLEKPLGHDLRSSAQINAEVAQHFNENQLYRIDHYLGKESVQNLMAVRFGNVLFEPLWRREWIDNVQITIAEELGVEGRGDFYDKTGALRDMVQNHLLQLLCMVAMEPPPNLSADAVRDEKLKVLKALRPFGADDLQQRVVRGQYRAGVSDGRQVPGYLDEPNVARDSRTETFVALRAEIANWRWSGVPFYLRTGKRLPERLAEIVVSFRDVPLNLFQRPASVQSTNRLVIRLQPEESISLHMLGKEPGEGMRLQPTVLNLDLHSASRRRRADAYERLLLDVIHGRLGLFMRRDELAAAWHWVEPILEAWSADDLPPRPYSAGTWGPAASNALLSRGGASWHEEI